MDPVKTFNALIGPMRRRVRLMISRALLSAVNDAVGLQVVQVKLLADEVRDSVERFQNYGFTSHPKPGAEGILACVSGNRDHGVVIVMDDRRFRLHLEEGEAALYDDLGHKVHLTRAGIVVDGGGHQIIFTNAPSARFEMDIEATGEIKDRCDTDGRTMSEMRAIYSGHNHPGDSGGTTGSPNQGM